MFNKHAVTWLYAGLLLLGFTNVDAAPVNTLIGPGPYDGSKGRIGEAIARGESIFYTADEQIWNRTELFLIPQPGDTPRRLSHPITESEAISEFSVTPSGDFAVYVVNGHDAYAVATGGGMPFPLFEDGQFDDFLISPDGETVFVATREANNAHALYLVSLSTRTVTLLEHLEPGESYWDNYAFSDNGDVLVYLTSDHLKSHDLETGITTNLQNRVDGENIEHLAVAPNGDLVAFDRGDALYTVSTAGGDPLLIHEYTRDDLLTTQERYARLEFSEDSNRVISLLTEILSVPGTPPGAFYFNSILSSKADGSGTTTIMTGRAGEDFFDPEFTLTPDGQWIVYNQYDGTEHLGLALNSVAGDEERILTEYRVPRFVFTDDGSRILMSVWEHQDTEPNGVYIADLSSSAMPVRLTPAAQQTNQVVDFSLSQNGDYLLYLAPEEPGGYLSIWSVPTAGGEAVSLFPGLSEIVPQSSFLTSIQADAVYIGLTYREPGDVDYYSGLFRLALDGSQRTEVNAPIISVPHVVVNQFDINPTGDKVVFHYDNELHYVQPSGGEISSIANADGSVKTEFLTGVDSMIYSVVKISYPFFLPAYAHFDLYMAPITENSPTTELYTLHTNYFTFYGFKFDLSPNSEVVVYTQVDGLYMTSTGNPGIQERVSIPLEYRIDFIDFLQIMDDSTTLVYTVDADGSGMQKLYLSPLTAESPVTNPDQPAADVDARNVQTAGAYVAYLVETQVNTRLEVLQPGMTSLQVSQEGEDVAGYTFNTDGTDLIYWTTDGNLYVTDLTAGIHQEIGTTIPGALSVAALSPDQQWIVVRAESPLALYRMNIDGSNIIRLTAPLPDDGKLGTRALVSDDSRFVFYLANHDDIYTTNLYRVSAYGAGREQVNGNLVRGTSVKNDFLVSSDGLYAIYLAYQGNGSLGLYSSLLENRSPADVVTHDFEESDENWTPPPVVGIFDRPAAQYDEAMGALSLTAESNQNVFGFWDSPRISVWPDAARGGTDIIGLNGADSLYRAIYTVSSNVSRAQAPVLRLRTSSDNFERSDMVVVSSVGEGSLSPGQQPRNYAHFFKMPEGQYEFLSSFEILNTGSLDAANASLYLHGMEIEFVGTAALGDPNVIATHDLAGESTRNLWMPVYDESGNLGIPAEFSENEGLSIRGATAEAPQNDEEVIFGFWETRIPYSTVGGKLYRLRATIESDAPAGESIAVPVFRIRVNTPSLMFSALTNLDSTNGETRTPTSGSPQVYDLWFEAPAEIAGEDLLVAFDYLWVDKPVDQYNADQDEPTIALTLKSLQIDEYTVPE